ncbi:hypothetical protein [Microbacterium proteolyticum]|uniref:hypothetical protein n=1 Tax=Microbacterium proteolyticum TaxID=1572644 RepID=UPI001FAD6FA1|nr:hypothetical protein [Microbacterium proteolyticum]MCI9857117.1 hypothetical protein [Microbacterium proteolyticum]
MSRPLHPDVALGMHLSAICSRNRYTSDPAPVIAKLLAVAGDRGDVLAFEVGRWAEYYDEKHTAVLVAAIVDGIPCAAEWTHEGRARRGAPSHGTTGSGPSYVPLRRSKLR